MQKIILTYGAIGGAVSISAIILSLTLPGVQDFGRSLEWLGYLIMLVALSTVFIGIKRYRDLESGGSISFNQGLLVGLGIATVAGVVYVLIWEVYLAITDHRFIQDYTQTIIAAREAEGMAGPELEALRAEMAEMREQYANPVFRLPMTFLEIFPVGLLITLVSATLLRKSSFMPASAP